MRLFRLFPVCLAIIFAACGVTPTTSPTTGGGASSTNTSPGTSTQGPLSIATDHAAYAPADLIHITLTNSLTTPIYAYDHQASCTIFGLEMQVGGTWRDIAQTAQPVAGCPLGRPTIQVSVAPGTPYHATVMAGYLHQGDHVFAPGTYRLRLSYATQPLSQGAAGPPPVDGAGMITITSATFTVGASA